MRCEYMHGVDVSVARSTTSKVSLGTVTRKLGLCLARGEERMFLVAGPLALSIVCPAAV